MTPPPTKFNVDQENHGHEKNHDLLIIPTNPVNIEDYGRKETRGLAWKSRQRKSSRLHLPVATMTTIMIMGCL